MLFQFLLTDMTATLEYKSELVCVTNMRSRSNAVDRDRVFVK